MMLDRYMRIIETQKSLNDLTKNLPKKPIIRRYCKIMKENVRQTKESSFNQYYNYVTRDDLVDIFGEEVVLTIKNYDSISLDDDVGEDDDQSPRSARFRSAWKSIDVRLVTNDGEVNKIESDDIEEQRDSSDNAPAIKSTEESRRGPGRPRRFRNGSESMADVVKKAVPSERESIEDEERRQAAMALLRFAPTGDWAQRKLDRRMSELFESR